MSYEEKFKEFGPIFYPRSIAIAGVSKNPGKIGNIMFRNFLAAGFKGDLYPVNPGGGRIQGMKIYSSLTDIQGPVDYVIVGIPLAHILPLIDDCAAKGVKAVQLFTAGFSETGKEEGRRIEREMVAKVRNAGVRIIGPNCVGVSCPASGIPVPTTGTIGKAGSIAFLSQSGGHAETLTDIGCVRNIRFSKMISFGNGSDLNEIDFLDYLALDPESRILGAYLEDGKNGRSIFQRIRNIARSKPVEVWKGGETDVGREITASHTGSLSGSHIMWETAINQAGAVQVTNVNELADSLLAFQNIPPLKRGQVAIISQLGGGAGGVAVSAADICSRHGLDIPHLDRKTQDRLESVIQDTGIILRNPFDLGVTGRLPHVLGDVLEIMDDDPNVDLIILNERIDFMLRFMHLDEIHAMNDVLIDFKRKKSSKPLMVVSTQASADAERILVESQLSEAQIPVYASFGRAARALTNVLKYWSKRTEMKG